MVMRTKGDLKDKVKPSSKCEVVHVNGERLTVSMCP